MRGGADGMRYGKADKVVKEKGVKVVMVGERGE